MPVAHEKQPEIKIDDLQPDWSAKSFKATWKERGLVAYADLTPIQDQPARGYLLECGYNTITGKEPTYKQTETGTTLVSKVRDLMTSQMALAGWQVLGKNIWQHSSRVNASSSPAIAPALEEKVVNFTNLPTEQEGVTEQGKRKVLSIPALAARKQSAGYTRTITARPVTYTCSRCGLEATKEMYPGPTPLYCDDCAAIVKKEQTRARVARLRAGKRGLEAD